MEEKTLCCDSPISIEEVSTPSEKVVLVTGGAGFIGSHVADALLQRGDRVIIVDEINDYYDVKQKHANLEILEKKHGERCTVYRGDICDIGFISNIFERERPSHVCHLAARAGVRASIIDPYIYVHSNIEGTTRLLDLSRKHSIKNFVYASSSSVYGCSDKEILSESDVVEKPVSPYAATKKACELLAYTFYHLYGLNNTGLRFFTVYGPRGRPDMAPYKFIDRVYRGVPIQQFGGGDTSRDYTYISDIVQGVVAAIDKPLGCEVINLGNGKPYLLKDFIQMVGKCVGRPVHIQHLPPQPGDVDRTCADISKAQRLLGYQPKVSFSEGIANMVTWYVEAVKEGLISIEDAEGDGHNSAEDARGAVEHKGVDEGAEKNMHKEASVGAMKREESDLELSSFVQKADRQFRMRTERILSKSK
eukprot:gene34505-41777_t